jgi:hypothetical protein
VDVPAFDPDEVALLAADDTTLSMTFGASDGAAALGLTNEDVRDVLSDLRRAGVAFYKSVASSDRPGSMFDVYHVTYCGRFIYLKFTIGTRLQPPRDRCIVVTSFKEK